MNPTALIAEDEPLLAQALQAELAHAWPALRQLEPAGDGDEAVERALAQRPDIVFLDIRMPGRSGLEAAAAIVEDWPADDAPLPLLVFVTAYDQYALQAFDAQAVDYLIKPLQRERLAASVQRLRARLAQRAPSGPAPQTIEQLRALLASVAPAPAPERLEVIQAGAGHTVHIVPIDDVVYFEAADKYVRVVTPQREHLVRMSLRELLPRLDPAKFWQVHRGTVVQARMVTSATRDESGKTHLTLRGPPERLTASRLYAHLFKPM